MAVLQIRKYGDPVLRRVAEPVSDFGPELEKLAADMLDSMQVNDGIGLAANQVGVGSRLIVIGIPEGGEEEEARKTLRIYAMANPEIVSESEETCLTEEGCLSLPEINVEVSRPIRVKVLYQNLRGERLELDAEGVLAVVVQHEIDHLDGVLITDYLPPLKRTMMRSRLKRISEEQDAPARR